MHPRVTGDGDWEVRNAVPLKAAKIGVAELFTAKTETGNVLQPSIQAAIQMSAPQRVIGKGRFRPIQMVGVEIFENQRLCSIGGNPDHTVADDAGNPGVPLDIKGYAVGVGAWPKFGDDVACPERPVGVDAKARELSAERLVDV